MAESLGGCSLTQARGRTAPRGALRRPAPLLVAGCVLALSGPAAAGPPYFTDDPGTMEHGHLFLYVAESGVWGRRSQLFPNLTFAYGVTPNFELSAGAATSPGTAVTSRPREFGDPFVAGKWRFLEEKGARPALAASYQVAAVTVDAGFGRGYAAHSAWITAGHSAGRGQVFAYLGANGSPRDSPSVLWGIAGDWPVSKRLSLGFELFGQSGAAGAGFPREFGQGIGLTYLLNDRTSLLLQVGHTRRVEHEATVYAAVLIELAR